MGSGNSKDQAASPPLVSSTVSATTTDGDSSSSSSSSSLHQPAQSQQQQQQSATATKPQEEGEEQSKCPMHRSDGSYSWDLSKALFCKTFPHWAGGSKPLTKEEAQALSTPPPSTTTDEPVSGCPVKHQQEETSGCPVKHSHNGSRQQQRPEYNVYSQPLDPSNQMPSNPNQLPAPTQSSTLSTERVASSIPKVCVRARIACGECFPICIGFCNSPTINSKHMLVPFALFLIPTLFFFFSREAPRRVAAPGRIRRRKCFTTLWRAREN